MHIPSAQTLLAIGIPPAASIILVRQSWQNRPDVMYRSPAAC